MPEVQCEKCKKNEAKYKRKPTVCMYCQLPAAFVDNKCVWCSYAERKNGPPVSCSQCKLKAAFPRDPSQRDKPLLCRMCLMAHKASAKNGSKGTPNSHHNHKSSSNVKQSSQHQKRKAEDSNDQKQKIQKSSSAMDSGTEHAQSEHILVIQQYKNEIHELQKKCAEKDRHIIERDKKIASLSAELMQLERDSKQKVVQIQKQHQDMTQSLHEQIRNLNKQIKEHRYTDAMRILNYELQRTPNVSPYYDADYALAAECYEQLTKHHPNHAEYRLYYAQALYNAFMFQEALNVVSQIEDEQLLGQVVKLEAAIKYREEDINNARVLVEQYAPDDPDIEVNLACLDYKEGNYEKALQRFNAATNTHGYEVSPYFLANLL
ncbi:unnamed protein product [Anisakis simplex]|uniref:Tetratricopeptide repeat protein 30 n=1 Tax=Anisakis simplex TaxID=6269 RepID=A0A158PPR9_ANISI|nr:unnamed protein product [Anisakis simplex]